MRLDEYAREEHKKRAYYEQGYQESLDELSTLRAENERLKAEIEKSIKLPCKIGDTVWVTTECGHIENVLDGTVYGANGELGSATGYYCPYELNDKCPHDTDDCDKCKNVEAVFEDEVDSIQISEREIEVYTKNCGVLDCIGNSVFLTKEAAEQALAERRQECRLSAIYVKRNASVEDATRT